MIHNMFHTSVEKSVKRVKATGNVIDIDMVANTDLNIHTIRRHQNYIFKTYSNEQYFIMTEPPGAGKSATLKFVMAKRLEADPNHKVVICIPQTLISKSFGHTILQYQDGDQIEWDIGKNLCDITSDRSKLKTLRNFLKRKKFPKGIHNRILITTHLALAALAKSMKSGEDLFKNTTLIMDEAHHILYSENGNSDYANMIGLIVRDILKCGDTTSSIWLTTATFFRGDRGSIISSEHFDKFTHHFLPLDQHWKENIKHIKSFEYNFVIYKENIFNEIKQLLKKGRKKSVIFCPYTGHLLSGIDKLIFRDRLITTIQEVWPDCNIMDLIDTNGRDGRKKVIFDDESAKNIDIILALKIFDEGSDWIYAEQVLDLAPSNSLRIQSQRNGRLWRDLPGKTHIVYNAFLPFRAKSNIEKDYRLHLSNSYNAFTAALLLRESIDPLPYPKTERVKSKKYMNSYARNPFEEEIPNESKRQHILNEVIKELMFLRNLKEKPTNEESQQCIRDSLLNLGISNDTVDNVVIHIAKILRSTLCNGRSLQWEKGIDVSFMTDAGFDKIWQNDIYNGLLTFGTEVSNISTFKEFRSVYNVSKKSSEWVEIAEKLANANNGILPAFSWLRNNGYSGLMVCKYKNPELFSHIPQKILVKSEEEWMELAEYVIENNNESIPPYSEFKRLGMLDLYRFISRYPEKFNHIRRTNPKKDRITPKEKKELAEKIASENGGILPCRSDLYKIHCGLSAHIDRNPTMYTGMKQYYGVNKEIQIIGGSRELDNKPMKKEKANNSSLSPRYTSKNEKDEKKRNFAQKIADENDGVLPKLRQLVLDGHGALAASIKRYPSIYKGIPQYYGRENRIKIIGKLEMTDNEKKLLAQKIADKNGGILPTIHSLRKEKHHVLAHDIISNPKTYKGMKQYHHKGVYVIGKENKSAAMIRKNRERRKLVEQLAIENGGILPKESILINRGLKALAAHIRRNPELYKGIKQYHFSNDNIQIIGEEGDAK